MPFPTNSLIKNGECRGVRPLCREPEGVPQNNFFPFLTRKGAREHALSIVERDGRKEFFRAPLREFRDRAAG